MRWGSGRKRVAELARRVVFCTARIQVEAYLLEWNSGSLERASFCLGGTLPETCPLERNSGSLERASFCLRRMLLETCLLERALGELEWKSLWLRSLERTLWRLERMKFRMRLLEWTDLRLSGPDVVWFFNLNEKKEGIEGIVRRKKTWSCQVA